VVLGLIVAAALALRLIGLGHELPQHSDEDPILVGQAETLRSLWAGERPARALEPHYPLLLAGALALWPLPAAGATDEAALTLDEHLARASRGPRRARLLVALLSTLAVPLTYLVARRFVQTRCALFAAALVATSLLHLQLSQAARPHGALASFLALGLWLDLRLFERGGWRAHLAAGAAAALALGTLHTGASALLPLAAAQLVRLRRDGARALPCVLCAWALVALVGWLAYAPPGLSGAGAELSTSQGVVNLSGHVFPDTVFDGGGFARVLPLLAQTDPVLVALALAGLALALAGWSLRAQRPGPAAWLVGAWALPFLLVLGLYGRLPARFLLPLVPVLAVLAALALQRLAARRPGPAPVVLAAALLALPLYAGARLAWLRARPAAAEVTAKWIEANLDPERDLLYLDASACPPIAMREEGGGRLFAASFLPWDAYLDALAPGAIEGSVWRTRRLIARDPRTQRLRQDHEALLGVLGRPAEEPAARRFAVVAFDAHPQGRDRACEAVLAAGGRARLCVPVLAGPLGDPDRGRLRALPRHTLATLLRTTRLGFTTVVYELPLEATAVAGD
jgi:hypothetical protein